jgi:hypothetical protein
VELTLTLDLKIQDPFLSILIHRTRSSERLTQHALIKEFKVLVLLLLLVPT